MPTMTPEHRAKIGAAHRALHQADPDRMRRMAAIRSAAEPAVWTPERADMLRGMWIDMVDDVAGLAKLNALPGPPIDSVKAMRVRASVLGLGPRAAKRAAVDAKQRADALARSLARGPKPPRVRHRAKPRPAPAPVYAEPEPCPDAADAAMARRMAIARKGLAKRDADPRMIAAHSRLPLREVFRLMAAIRDEKRATPNQGAT